MKFIDLFAGLGGFNVALSKLGHECVFACEINDTLRKLYEDNFNMLPEKDIKLLDFRKIPKHDILCAGFPCQPFSKAGRQLGLGDEKNGNLLDYIVAILKEKEPKYFILENVPHIKKHDDEKTWDQIVNKIGKGLNYNIDSREYSPHDFGIPQHRKRVFIVGSKNDLSKFTWPRKTNKALSVGKYISSHDKKARKISTKENKCLNIWQQFINTLPLNVKIPKFPIWAMEYCATYPFTKTTPYSILKKSSSLKKYKGCFGKPISYHVKSNITSVKTLPSYARTKEKKFPEWKIKYIYQNRTFFKVNAKALQQVMYKIEQLGVPSWQKFEWNCRDDSRKVRDHFIQFRPSGIRVKDSTFFPSLVCTPTQVPIIGWRNRYLTKRECARLQSLTDIKLPVSDNIAYRALGNAVNADIVLLIAKSLIK